MQALRTVNVTVVLALHGPVLALAILHLAVSNIPGLWMGKGEHMVDVALEHGTMPT